MNIGAITRFGNQDPCETLRTGIASFDTFLSNIDQNLFGSGPVRALTLMEIRSHLVDKQEYYLESGLSEEESIHNAIQSMGNPIDIAGPQRDRLVKKFTSFFLFAGSVCGLGLGIFGGLLVYTAVGFEAGVGFGLISGLLAGILYGLFMGMYSAFYTPDRQLPSASVIEIQTEGSATFSVCLDRWNKILTQLLLMALLLGGSFYLLIGLTALFVPSLNLGILPWWLNLLVAAGTLPSAILFLSIFYEFQIDDDGILVNRAFYQREFCAWQDLREVGLWRDLPRFAPFAWKTVWYAEYETKTGKRRRFPIFPSMNNADKLIALLQEKAKANNEVVMTPTHLQAR